MDQVAYLSTLDCVSQDHIVSATLPIRTRTAIRGRGIGEFATGGEGRGEEGEARGEGEEQAG